MRIPRRDASTSDGRHGISDSSELSEQCSCNLVIVPSPLQLEHHPRVSIFHFCLLPQAGCLLSIERERERCGQDKVDGVDNNKV